MDVALVESIGKEFILHSGRHKLIIKDGSTSVIENGQSLRSSMMKTAEFQRTHGKNKTIKEYDER